MNKLTQSTVLSMLLISYVSAVHSSDILCESPPIPLNPNADVFAAISVADVEKSSRWYQHLFGLKKTFSYRATDGSVEIVALSAQGLTVELQQHKIAISNNPPDGKTFLQHGIFKFGISVTDVRAAVATLKNCGDTVVIEPFDDSNSKTVMAVIQDNSSNLIQLTQMRR